jgi:hypothetical protein
MAERPAPLVLVVVPPGEAPFGSYTAVAETARGLLAAELSQRLGRLGAAVAPLHPDGAAHWGRWFAAAAREALAAAPDGAPVDAIGYAGAGSLALLPDDGLDELLSPIAGEVVANNRFSADAFVVAGDLNAALAALEGCPTDNAAVRCLESAGFTARVVGGPWSRFDLDTPLDAALLRIASRLPGTRRLAGPVSGFLEMAQLPGGRGLEVPHLAEIGAVMRDRSAQLLVAGRVPTATATYLETETACRIRLFVEERGMRSARDTAPRSLLASLLERTSPATLIAELASLGDAVVLDTRVLMAARSGSSDASAWPAAEDRFASDFGDSARVEPGWLRELTEAASAATTPFLLGGHTLVSDGLRLVVDAAWSGR